MTNAPDFDGLGNIEVESTPDHVVIRLSGDGDVMEMDLNYERAVQHAATVMFCAVRLAPNPDAALERFLRDFTAAGKGLKEQAARAAIFSTKDKPS